MAPSMNLWVLEGAMNAEYFVVDFTWETGSQLRRSESPVDLSTRKGRQHWRKAPNQMIFLFDSMLGCSWFTCLSGIKVADSARHPFHETIKPHTMRCFNLVLVFYLIQRQGHCTSSSSPWLFIALIIASIQPACPITSDNADEFRSVGFFRRGWKHLETISLGAQETDS